MRSFKKMMLGIPSAKLYDARRSKFVVLLDAAVCICGSGCEPGLCHVGCARMAGQNSDNKNIILWCAGEIARGFARDLSHLCVRACSLGSFTFPLSCCHRRIYICVKHISTTIHQPFRLQRSLKPLNFDSRIIPRMFQIKDLVMKYEYLSILVY
uniref:Uncharacterized protein n=1 Tax=Kalanchoe fedtschenkoi TaxID=63787 RepID=A0A7N0UB36_KALFE